MEFNIQAGVHGFWVAGGTGESILLDDAENRRIADIAADQSPGAHRQHYARGRADHRTRGAVGRTRGQSRRRSHLLRTSILLQPERTEGSSSTTAVVAAAADLPFFVYNLPGATGVEITPDLMAKIQEGVPQLAGLKHSAPYIPYVKTFAEMGLACLIGNNRLMLPALTIGATGCVDGPPNMAPELWVAIWNAYQAGDMAAAQESAGEGFSGRRGLDRALQVPRGHQGGYRPTRWASTAVSRARRGRR